MSLSRDNRPHENACEHADPSKGFSEQPDRAERGWPGQLACPGGAATRGRAGAADTVRPRSALRIGVGKTHWIGSPLPPNRTGGSPAYGSPVGGLTSKRIDGASMGRGQVQQPLLEGSGIAPGTIPHGEGRQQTGDSRQRFEPRHVGVGLSGAVSPDAWHGQSHRGVFRRFELHVSTFLHPFAPPELPGFDATMGALTPTRRLFVS